jgi:aspartate-semialdehyde dehydrogenase
MLNIGFIGYRGMVGSVLFQRIFEENDYKKYKIYLFSTSNINGDSPNIAQNKKLYNAYNLEQLSQMDVIVTTQGSDYTKEVYNKLRNYGYNGYWIDASSYLRLAHDSIIVLDPVNEVQIKTGITNGIKDYIGGNCSITLSLLGLRELFTNNLVSWMSMMTYQAASGAGAKHVRELIQQMQYTTKDISNINDQDILSLITNVNNKMKDTNFPIENFSVPLASSLIPWIDSDLKNGMSKEEFKGEIELNKILGNDEINKIRVDGLCVRVPVIRSHSAGITIKLNDNLKEDEIENLIAKNPYAKVINNSLNDSVKYLSPYNCQEKLQVLVGRIRKSNLEENMLHLFTVGDQLLWGAAEPIRRIINIIVESAN